MKHPVLSLLTKFINNGEHGLPKFVVLSNRILAYDEEFEGNRRSLLFIHSASFVRKGNYG